MPISVVIPTYNRAAVLEQTILRLLSLLNDTDQLIVVNNASTDQTAAVLRNLQQNYSHLLVLFEAKKGPSYARNTGLQKAKHPLVVFLDDDCLVTKKWVQVCHYLADQPSFSFVLKGSIMPLFAKKSLLTQFFSARNQYLTHIMPAPLHAGNFLVPKKIALLELFDEKNFPYIGEELELEHRLTVKKIRILHLPFFVVRHQKKMPTFRSSLVRNFQYGYSHGKLSQKYPSSPQLLALFKQELQKLPHYHFFKEWHYIQKALRPNLLDRIYLSLLLFWGEIAFRLGSLLGKQIKIIRQ